MFRTRLQWRFRRKIRGGFALLSLTRHCEDRKTDHNQCNTFHKTEKLVTQNLNLRTQADIQNLKYYKTLNIPHTLTKNFIIYFDEN